MPGVNLNLDLPSLADDMATIVSKIVTALSSIQTDLAAQVVPSEIYVNQALAMNGAAIVNVGSVQLAAGNAPTVAGSIYYSAGEFYAVDSAGAFRISNNGALDVTAAGTIGGDYGGSNPAAVTYNDASGEYRFTQDTGVWADLVAAHLTLEGTNGSVKFGVDNAINSARQFNIKTLPIAGVSMLVYDGATSSVNDGAVQRATNPLLVTDIDVFGELYLEGTSDLHHGLREKQIPLQGVGTFLGTFSGISIPCVGTPWVYRSPFLDVRVGDKILGYTAIVGRNLNSSTITATLQKLTGASITPTLVTSSTSTSTSTADHNQGPGSLAQVVASGERYYIEITGNVSTGHAIISTFYTWMHP